MELTRKEVIEKVLSNITKEDLTYDLKMLEEEIGIERVRDLIHYAGGWQLNIPTARFFRKAIYQVLSEFNFNKNLMIKVAKEFFITHRQVENICKVEKKKEDKQSEIFK